MKTVKYSIKKSQEPNEFPFIVYFESKTEHGFNCGRIFKGTYEACEKVLKELLKKKEIKKNGKRNKKRCV